MSRRLSSEEWPQVTQAQPSQSAATYADLHSAVRRCTTLGFRIAPLYLRVGATSQGGHLFDAVGDPLAVLLGQKVLQRHRHVHRVCVAHVARHLRNPARLEGCTAGNAGSTQRLRSSCH